MNRIQHRSNNDVLGAPAGVSIEACNALPITRVAFREGDDAVVSFWAPTAAQIALIASGRPVRLCVWGVTHAPLSLGVEGDGDMGELE